jgi:hypothetical protein
LAKNRFDRTWPSGARSGGGEMSSGRDDKRNDSVFTPVGLWVTQRVLTFSGRYSARLSPAEVTTRTSVTLAPDPGMDLFAQWSCFFIQWVFWPDEHYRRYLPNEDQGAYGVTIYHATSSDWEIFELLPQVGPISVLQTSSSKLDGYAIEQIAKVKSTRILSLDAVEANSAELAPLGTLNRVDYFLLHFNRTIQPKDLVFLKNFSGVHHVVLAGPSFEPGCDDVLADLINQRILTSLHIETPAPQPGFPLAQQAASGQTNIRLEILEPFTFVKPATQPAPTTTPEGP